MKRGFLFSRKRGFAEGEFSYQGDHTFSIYFTTLTKSNEWSRFAHCIQVTERSIKRVRLVSQLNAQSCDWYWIDTETFNGVSSNLKRLQFYLRCITQSTIDSRHPHAPVHLCNASCVRVRDTHTRQSPRPIQLEQFEQIERKAQREEKSKTSWIQFPTTRNVQISNSRTKCSTLNRVTLSHPLLWKIQPRVRPVENAKIYPTVRESTNYPAAGGNFSNFAELTFEFFLRELFVSPTNQHALPRINRIVG